MKHAHRIGLGFIFLLAVGSTAVSQSVAPIITEYKEKGEGKIQLTNNTLVPLVVTIQPLSFSIAPNGTAIYRRLDPSIHVELSTTSIRLEPRQDYYVFYKTHADSLPAWYTIYATFSPMQRGPGINVRIMLPHTVYLYQKASLQKDDVRVEKVSYLAEKKVVVCDIENLSKAYGRMREGTIQSGKDSTPVNGFPLLPGNPRHLEIPWTGAKNPELIILHFDHFEIKLPVNEASPDLVAAIERQERGN